MLNYVVMYSMSFSVGGYQTFRRVQDLNMIRLTILSKKNMKFLLYFRYKQSL